MIPAEVANEAGQMGYDGVVEIQRDDGEAVFLLIPPDGARVGLPQYLHYVDGLLMPSTYEESIEILSHAYFEEGE